MNDSQPLTMVEYLNAKIKLEKDTVDRLSSAIATSPLSAARLGAQLEQHLAWIEAFQEARVQLTPDRESATATLGSS